MFRIGEFSKISQTPISQLRYYDEIGIFKPEYTHPASGYRYYGAAQLPDLNRIMAMKELGLTLEQIKRLVDDDVSAEELRGMLSLRKAQVEQELHSQIGRLHHIEARLRQFEREGDMTVDDVILKELPRQSFYSFRVTLSHLRDAGGYLQEMNKLLPSRVPETKLGNFSAVFHGDGFDTENVDAELGFYVSGKVDEMVRLSGGQDLTVRDLPRVETAASVVRVGGVENSYDCYGSIGRWVEAEKLTLLGPVREVFIQGPFPDRIEDTVAEIQVPVIRELPQSLPLGS